MKSLGSQPPRPPSAMSDDRPSGLPRPKVLGQARAPAAAPASSSDKAAPFITSDSMPRSARLKRDSARWLLEPSPKSDLVEYLSAQMEQHTAPETFALLFSKDHRAEEDYMAGLSTIAEFYDESDSAPYGLDSADALQAVQSANADLAVKYAALKLLSNNTQLANRCLEVISSVLGSMRRLNERFSDVEARLFAPALVFKVCSRHTVRAQLTGSLAMPNSYQSSCLYSNTSTRSLRDLRLCSFSCSTDWKTSRPARRARMKVWH